LSGTPTQFGAYVFTVVVTDSSGGTGPYTSGQQLGIIVTPPGFSYDAASKVLTITGTASNGNDFELSQASTLDGPGVLHTTTTLTLFSLSTFTGDTISVPDFLLAGINVTAQGPNPNAATLITNDTYTGSDGLQHETFETVGLGPSTSHLFKYDAHGGLAMSVQLDGFLTIYAYVGHSDTGGISATPGGENIFVTAGAYSYVTGQGQYYEISGARYVYGYSANASDQAWHYDTAALDAFVASGNAFSYMSGTDAGQSFFNVAVGFQVVYGIATHGQSYAYLIDSPGNDVFVGYAPYSYMSGTDSTGSLVNVAEGFLLVYAQSFVDGTDYAYNYDPSHNILNSRWILLT
jgi:hypothetical protein